MWWDILMNGQRVYHIQLYIHCKCTVVQQNEAFTWLRVLSLCTTFWIVFVYLRIYVQYQTRQEDYAIQWTIMNFVKKYCHTGKHIPLEVLSTELTISWARSLPSVAPLFSYRNKLKHFPYMEYAIHHTCTTVKSNLASKGNSGCWCTGGGQPGCDG